MRQLFEEICRDGESVLARLVSERRQESTDLDFKTKQDPSKGGASRDDLQTFGRILSAFSNSMGGLLIWGVDARKDPNDEVDCAANLIPIQEIERFRSDLVRAAGQLLMPRHDGIQVETIPDKINGGGFVAVYVERSERRPHMSTASGDGRYYKRAGDSTFRMEHYDIEDSFKRLVVPDLTLTWSALVGSFGSSPDGVAATLRILLALANHSSVSARFPYLAIDEVDGVRRSEIDNSDAAVHTRGEGSSVWYEGGTDCVIHPGVRRAMMSLRVRIPFVQLGTQQQPQWEAVSSISLTYRCGGEHSRVTGGKLIILPIDLENAVRGQRYFGGR